MTNATIFENNSTSNDQIKQNCNITGDKESQNCTANIVQVQNNNCSNNINGSNTNSKDCNGTVTTEGNQGNQTKNNQIVDNDTVLKYVYKKDDKTTIPIKSKGHAKNSIHRRKRSTDDTNDSPLPSKIVRPAVIVNYETSHGAPLAEPIHKPPNTISGANLADFSIQTVHDNKPNQDRPEKDSSEIENDVDKSNESKVRGENTPNGFSLKAIHDSRESGERQDYQKVRGENDVDVREYPQNIKSNSKINDDKKSLARDDSDEYDEQRNRQSSREVVGSGEHIQAYSNNKPSHEESGEYVGYNNKQPSQPYDESSEVNNYKTIKPRGEHHKSDEVQDFNTSPRSNNGERENYNNKKPSQNDNSSEEEYVNNKPSHGHNNGDKREHRKNINTSSVEDRSDESADYKNNKPIRDYDRSSERAEHRNREPSREYDSSSERGDYLNKAPAPESSNSEERRDNRPSGEYNNSEEVSEERGLPFKNNKNSVESTENGPINNEKYLSPQYLSKETSDEHTKARPKSAESEESLDTHDRNNYKRNKPNIEKSTEYKQDDTSRETQRLGDVNKSKINYDNRSKLNLDSSSKSSSESDEDELIPEDKQQNFASNVRKDLPQNGYLIGIDPKTAVEILPLTTAIPQLDLNTKPLKAITNDDTLLNPKINKLIHINDGEVKPVVEINTENDNDSSEENTKSSHSDEADSLESILGVKESENDNSQSDKLVRQQEPQQGDVKQQFERIPLNYKHDNKNDDKVTDAPKEEKTEVAKDEGTLDVFAPEDVKYDDNLNIKFDDLAIKLPEIKLPDDILSYTLEKFPYNDKKQHKHDSRNYDEPRHYYSHDDKARTKEDQNKEDKDNSDDGGDDDDDEDHKPDSRYYDYYGHEPQKSNYKKKDNEKKGEEDENEDLYEKFVRERFGKRGTFEKRSEKLETAALSPQLYDTVKSILKKTADIDKQAKKSGDPNANYMWTLEYGEKL